METIWNTLYGIEDADKEQKVIEKRLAEMINMKGFTCLDIGFNYGWWSWLFLKNIGRQGKVYAWEPNKFLFDTYLSRYPFKNLVAYNHALSDRQGVQDYYIYGHDGWGSGMNTLEKYEYDHTKAVELIEVKTDTLDDWWSSNGEPNVDFIKIDCEGHDDKVLLGGKRLLEVARPKFVIVEKITDGIAKFFNDLQYTDQNQFSDFGLDDKIWMNIMGSNNQTKEKL